jgi:hypothetical protein
MIALLLLACFPRVDAPATQDTGVDDTSVADETGGGEDTSPPDTSDTQEPPDTSDTSDTGAPPDTSDTGTNCVVDDELGAVEGDAIASGTTSGDAVEASCGGEGQSDTVLSWSAPRAGVWTLDTVGSPDDTVLWAFETSCGSEIACDDDTFDVWSSLTLDLAAGEAVLLGVEGGDWVLNAWSATCVDANVGSTEGVEGNTEGLDTTLSVPSSCSDSYATDVVLRWVAPSRGLWVFSTEGSDFDTVLSLRPPSCTAAATVCSDDATASGTSVLWSQVSQFLDVGEVVFLSIGGFEGQSGDYVLTATLDG